MSGTSNPVPSPVLLSVCRARATEMLIGGRPVLTGIGKRAVSGPVAVNPLGLSDDEQADLSVHGGPSKAVYAYPSEHYGFWQTVRTQARVPGAEHALPHGAMGENLTLSGLVESQVWVGDLLKFPNCTLAVSEPRMPCFKFGGAMGFPQAVKLMAQSGWCGFYLSVREPGTLEAGQAFELVPGPREVGIAELFRAKTGRQHDR